MKFLPIRRFSVIGWFLVALWVYESFAFSTSSFFRYPSRPHNENNLCSFDYVNQLKYKICSIAKLSMAPPNNVLNLSLRELRDHKRDAKYLRDRIQIWLDGECSSQEVHTTVAKVVEAQYLQSRKTGIENLEQLEKHIVSSLESIDMTSSLMNAHDVAKKCSNLILLLLNQKLCLQQFYNEGDCHAVEDHCAHTEAPMSSRSFMPVEKFEILTKQYKSEFLRYRLLRDFLEADVDWEEVQPMMEILLGCRKVDAFIRTKHHPHLAPRNWKDLHFYPDFTNASDTYIDEKLRQDIPPNENDADIILETLMGGEYLKLVKKEGNPDMQRRMLLVQWMYAHGFLGNEFPPKEEVIPGHLLAKNAEDEWSKM